MRHTPAEVWSSRQPLIMWTVARIWGCAAAGPAAPVAGAGAGAEAGAEAGAQGAGPSAPLTRVTPPNIKPPRGLYLGAKPRPPEEALYLGGYVCRRFTIH